MKPPEEALRGLVAQWVSKADQDLAAATRLQGAGPFREVVGFHAQQAVEKYLKALLVYHQIEFRKTHDIRLLLDLIARIRPETANDLRDAETLSPFAVIARYPGEYPETRAETETAALAIARKVREAIVPLLKD